MIIEMNVDYLYKCEITPAQYLFLSLCFKGKHNTATKMVHKEKITKKEIEDLVDKGYILNWVSYDNSKDITFSKSKLELLFDVRKTEYFWELFSTYPIKVNSNRGERVLRPQSSDAKEAKECKKKYDSYLGNEDQKAKHEHVMKCLDAELSFRRKNNSMGFMRALITWINKQDWYSYEHLIDLNNTTKNKPSYGEKLI